MQQQQIALVANERIKRSLRGTPVCGSMLHIRQGANRLVYRAVPARRGNRAQFPRAPSSVSGAAGISAMLPLPFLYRQGWHLVSIPAFKDVIKEAKKWFV